MFENVLPPQTKSLLQRLQPANLPEGTYLGGGTAVVLFLGHRKSADLDFFTSQEFVEKQWEQKLARELGFKLLQRDWQTLIGTIEEVKVSLFGYKYKPIGQMAEIYQMKLASLPDLAAMKLDTMIGRGAKRDFVDVYFLAQKYGLQTLFEFYDRKYGNLEERALMLKKALVYFAEAEGEEMPEMLLPVSWKKIKAWFLESFPK